MSINLENPDTIVGMIDAAANYVAQIRLATSIGDKARVHLAVEEAARLLGDALQKAEELGLE